MPDETKVEGVTLPPISSAKKESGEGDEEKKEEETEAQEAELIPVPPEKPNPKTAASLDEIKPSNEPEPSLSSTAPTTRPIAGNVTHKPAASTEGEPIAPIAPPTKTIKLSDGLEEEGEDLTHSKSCTDLKEGGEASKGGDESKGETENNIDRKDIQRSTSEGKLSILVDMSTWKNEEEGQKGGNGDGDSDEEEKRAQMMRITQKKLQDELLRIAELNDILAQTHDSLLIDDLDQQFNGIYEYAGERNGHAIYQCDGNELSWWDRWCLCHKGVQVFHRDEHFCWHRHVKFSISPVPFTSG